jgi:hypothetical protein
VRRVGLTALLLLACGRTAPVRGVYSGPGATTDGGAACESSCTTSPPDIRTPLATAASGAPLHWLTCEGCIRVTVDPTVGSNLGFLGFLLNEWDITSAGGLCLSKPELAAAPAPAETQRIHFVPGSTPRTTLIHDEGGTIRQATVVLTGTTVEQLTEIGHALGLAENRDAAQSVMSTATTRNSPGPSDLVTLRALYGEPAWCER